MERFREVPDGADFYAPVTGLFRADPTRTDEPALDALLALVQPGERWLDIGAGAGRYALPIARALAPSGGEVIALDPSASMLGGLREIAAEHDIDNVRTVEGRWPPADPTPFAADVALIAHVGYDIEAIGPFLDAMESARGRLCVAMLMERQPSSIADVCWPPVHGEPRVPLPALPEFLELLRARDRDPSVQMLERAPRRFESRDELEGFLRRQLWIEPGGAADGRFRAAMDDLIDQDPDGRVGLLDQRPMPIGIVTWAPGGDGMTGRRSGSGWPADGRAVRPGGLAGVARRESRDVERRAPRLVAPRLGQNERRLRGGGRRGAVRRLDRFVAGRLDDQRGLQWFSPRRPTSGWARTNKARVERLIADGLMLPAGLAAIEEAKRNGSWTLLDDVENLVVPDDLAAALAAHPPAREHWDAFSRSRRRALLEWITQAKRPETRANRIAEAAEHAARNEVRRGFDRATDLAGVRSECQPITSTSAGTPSIAMPSASRTSSNVSIPLERPGRRSALVDAREDEVRRLGRATRFQGFRAAAGEWAGGAS